MSRKGKGRNKLEMVKIQKESNLLVTFSKRRFGVFKKASELSTLCGAELAVVVFSPGGKAFSFGHPSVESVLQRYLSRNPAAIVSGTQQLVEAQRNAMLGELNEQLTKIENDVTMEMKRGQELDRIRKVSEARNWWELPVEQLDLAQVQQLKEALLMLKQKVANQVEHLLFCAASITNNNNRQFLVPSSSTRNAVLPYEGNKNGGFNSNIMPNYQHNRLGFGNGFF